ncbi:MAG: hypothetical protein ACOH5I_25575 [Oligoflexus sp.]
MKLERIKKEFKPVWQAKKGHGSFLTFDMGEKIERTYETKAGSYLVGSEHLWIYMCQWKLLKGDRLLLDSQTIDGAKDCEKILASLVGSRITSIGLSEETVEIFFSNGIKLELFASCDQEDEMFILYEEGQPTISYYPTNGLVAED